MSAERVGMRPMSSGQKGPVPSETWALLSLVLSSVLTLLWIGIFAWANARGVGLF
jgi:hypothetical protein